MDTPLRVLLIEDSESDAALVIRQLKKADYAVTVERVETAAQMTAALEKQAWDCVIADYQLPQFDAPAALAVLQATGLDLPFIVVSGTIGEETAVALMKAGAHDYLMKDKLARLAPAVKRELAEAQSRRARQRAEESLRLRESYLTAILENQPGLVWFKDVDGRFLAVNQAFADSCGKTSPADLVGKTDRDVWPAELAEKYQADDAKIIQDKAPTVVDEPIFDRGNTTWFETFKTPILDNLGRVIGTTGYSRDITDRKQAEQEHVAHLQFLENMDKVNRAIQGTRDLEQMMSDVLEATRSIFESDRAWLVYPCDPDAPSFRVPMEITRPEYPGARALNVDVPMSPGEAQNMQEALESDTPVTYVAGTDRPISTARQFGVQSQMFVPVYPKLGKPWVFGMHQCSYPRVWTQAETKLFQEIGRRLEDALTSLLAYRDLRESEERHRLLFENAPVGILSASPQGQILELNPATVEILGSPSADATKAINVLTFPPLVQAGFSLDFQKCVELRQPVWGVCPYVTRWGKSIYFHYRLTPMSAANGQPVQVQILLEDITERRDAEEALRQSKELFRVVLTNILDPVFITNDDGQFTFICPNVPAILGYSLEYIRTLGNISNLVSGGPVGLTELDARGEIANLERAVVDRDGRRRIFLMTVKRVSIGKGTLLYAFHDITERKYTEEALRESQRRLATLISNLPGMAYRCKNDADWTMEFVSEGCQALTGYTSQQLLNSHDVAYARLIHPDDREMVWKMVQAGVLAKQPYHMEYRIQTAGGQVKWVWEQGQAIYVDTGELSALEGLITDITERKWAEDRYRQLFEKAPLMDVLTHNKEGIPVITDCNQAFLSAVGYRRDEVVGRSLADFYTSESRGALFNQGYVRALEEKFDSEERAFVARTGHIIQTMLTAVPEFDTEGRVIGTRAMYVDITARKTAEGALRDKVATLQAVAEIDREIMTATVSGHVLELVCRRAAELVHAPKAVIAIRTAAADLVMAASFGLSDAVRVGDEFIRNQQAGIMLSGTLMTHEVIALYEIDADIPYMAEMRDREGVRALAIVPLVVGEESSGALIILDTTAHQWQAADLQVLNMLAGQAALALEKLRLLETVSSRALRLATLNEIGQAVTSSLDLDLVLTTLLEKVRQATEAEACSVALIDQASGDLVFRQAVGGVAYAMIGLRLAPGQGLAGWVAQHRQSILVPDVAADERSYQLRDRTNFITRDLIAVPLITRDVVTGVIELVNKRSGRFDEDDRRLLESVAAQASIAIEHARLFETEHAGREALETLYRIGQAVNSTLDADAILDRLTDEALRTTHATHGSALVARPDRGCFERRSLRGYSPEQVARARTDWLSLDRGVNGRAYRSQEVVYVEDVQIDPDYHSLIEETHSELAVPIMHGSQVIGNLDLQSPAVDAFRDVRLDFLRALTDQVAIALENARLFAETRRHADEMSIVSQVALVGVAGQTLDETVARATGALSQLWPEASLGFLFVDETSQSLRLHSAYRDSSPVINAAGNVPLDRGLTGWVVRERQPIQVGDVAADSRYFLITPDTQSEMAAPLVAGQRVIGVINVECPRLNAFSGEDLRLLTTLAGQLTTIFEKARLDAELSEHAARLEQRVQERTAEIRRAQARTQAILDALGEGVVVTDTHGTIQYMNPAMEQVTGYSASESIGQNPRLWQSGRTPLDVYATMWATILAGQTWRGEIVNRRKSGELYFASLAAAPIPGGGDSQEPIAGLVGVQRDITPRMQAEEDMRRALEKERELNNLKSRFVSTTSHEFRTPLTSILLSAEMLEHYGERWTAERKLEHLRRIQTAVKYMTGLLNDILIIGKTEAGKLEFVPGPLDLLKFCRDLAEEMQVTDTANRQLIFEGEPDCAQASMDEQLLRHILSNLLSNALKYSPPGGRVQFNLACQSGQARFRIQDHGLGIPAEDQAHLFETFYRAGNVRTIAGTGLGLTIVKRSVDLHGGTIDVASQVGVGTTVTVTLPLSVSSNA